MTIEAVSRKVTLKGICPIMFDRYAGDNNTDLKPEEKMYLTIKGELVLPMANIMSFLCAINTESAAKRFHAPKEYKRIAQNILSFTAIEQAEIPITKNGKPVKWEGWGKNGITLHKSVARLPKGIPNPKERPVLDAPWEMEFNITIWESPALKEGKVKAMFTDGGLAIGLGTFRGVYGKFKVTEWK
ncbi:MAG: hypothetical protein ACYTEQ_27955 [Planctomycetota bacterium]|jgi:hypothetical protein